MVHRVPPGGCIEVQVVVVTSTGRPNDASKDIGTSTESIGEPVQKLGVHRVTLAAHRPVARDPDREPSTQTAMQPLRELLPARHGPEIEPFQVERVTQRVLADTRRTPSAGATGVGSRMDDSTRRSTVHFDSDIASDALEGLQPGNKCLMDTHRSRISEVSAAMAGQRIGGAVDRLVWSAVARHRIERIDATRVARATPPAPHPSAASRIIVGRYPARSCPAAFRSVLAHALQDLSPSTVGFRHRRGTDHRERGEAESESEQARSAVPAWRNSNDCGSWGVLRRRPLWRGAVPGVGSAIEHDDLSNHRT